MQPKNIFNDKDVKKFLDGDVDLFNKVVVKVHASNMNNDDLYCKLLFNIIDNCDDKNRFQIVERLINEISSLSIKDISSIENDNMETLLIMSIRKCDVNMVKTLLRCGIDPNIESTGCQQYALKAVILYPHHMRSNRDECIQIAKSLLIYGADQYMKLPDGVTIRSVDDRNWSVLKSIDMSNDLKTEKNNHPIVFMYKNPLSKHSIKDSLYIIEYMKEGKLSIFETIEKLRQAHYRKYVDEEAFCNILYYAINDDVKENRHKIIERLIKESSPISTEELSRKVDVSGRSFLVQAIDKQDPEMVKILLECEIDPNFYLITKNSGIKHSLISAMEKPSSDDNLKIINILVNKGIDPVAMDYVKNHFIRIDGDFSDDLKSYFKIIEQNEKNKNEDKEDIRSL